MDRLNYTYRDGTNQLWSVQDGIAAGAYAGDIDNQGGSNYSYDRIGNLIGDVSENISQVNWTVYGKIGNIQKKQAFLGYVYNAGGERVVKQYLPYATNQCLGCDENTGLEDLEVYERNSKTPSVYKASKTITFLSEYTDVRYRDYSAIIDAGLAQCTPQCNVQPALNTSDADIYIRDATGNTLAVYHYDRKTSQLRWSEQHLYGSARLGMYLPEKSVISLSTESKQREVGYLGKQVFELSNHLGNILATITDKKLQVSTNTISTAYFEADVQTVQDYYAFGMQMPGRKLSGGYRYGFNGKENDNEVAGEGNALYFEFREYDPRLGRFKSIDPKTAEYAWQSPYVYHRNNPINAVDYMGLGDPPSKLYTNTEAGQKIITKGFDANTNGKYSNYNWFSTTSNAPGTGRTGKGLTLEVTGIDVSKAQTITKAQTTAWTGESMKELGFTQESLKALQKADPKAYGQAISKINGSLYSKVGAYMDNMNQAAYFLEKDGTYAVSDALANRGTINRAGGSASAIKALNGLKWAGRTLVVVAVAKDLYDIHNSGYEPRTVVKKAGFWAGAWAGGAAAGAGYTATGLDLTGPWGWAGHAATTLIGGIAGGFAVEAITETVYDYVTRPGVKPGVR